jgi:hypothetical protein
MIRVSYWQFRLPLAIALGGLTVVAVIAGLTGPGVVHLYDTTVANCAGHGGDCSTALSLFNAHDQVFKVIVEAIPSACRRSSACSGARRSSPASLSPARSAWR